MVTVPSGDGHACQVIAHMADRLSHDDASPGKAGLNGIFYSVGGEVSMTSPGRSLHSVDCLATSVGRAT